MRSNVDEVLCCRYCYMVRYLQALQRSALITLGIYNKVIHMKASMQRGMSATAVIIVIAVVVLGGAAGYGVYTSMGNGGMSGGTGGNGSPEEVLTSMLSSMKDVRAASYDATVSLKGSQQNGQFEGTMSIQGATDARDMENTKSKADITVDFSGSPAQQDTQVSGKLSFKTRQLKDMMYVKPGDISVDLGNQGGMQAAMANAMIKQMKKKIGDRWIEMSAEKGAQQAQMADEAPIKDPEKLLQAGKIVRDEFTSVQPYSVKNDHGTESVNGVDSYHYTISIDMQKLMTVFSSVMERLKQEGIAEISDQEMKRGKEQLNKMKQFLAEKEDPVVDVWVGTENMYLRKVALQPYSFEADAAQGSMSGEVSFEATMSDFNKDVSISAPSNTVKMETLMQQMMGSMMQQQGGAGGMKPQGQGMPSGMQ